MALQNRKITIFWKLLELYLLEHRLISESYWADVVTYAVYLMNRMPSRVHNYRTPLAVLADHVTLSSMLQLSPRVFGCVAYVHLHKNQHCKLML